MRLERAVYGLRSFGAMLALVVVCSGGPAAAVAVDCSTGSPDVTENVWQGTPTQKQVTFMCQYDTNFDNDPTQTPLAINDPNGPNFFGYTDWIFDSRWNDNVTGGTEILGFDAAGPGTGGATEFTFDPVGGTNATDDLAILDQYDILLFFKGSPNAAPNGGVAYKLSDLELITNSQGVIQGFYETPFQNANNGQEQQTSHISVYYRPIPLPASAWLLLGGLGALGGISAMRRRRAAASPQV